MFFYFAFTAFCDFRKAKNRPKNVSKRHFFPILGTIKMGDAYERPGFRPKSSPQPGWSFSGSGVGGSAACGAPHHRALVALGRSAGGAEFKGPVELAMKQTKLA